MNALRERFSGWTPRFLVALLLFGAIFGGGSALPGGSEAEAQTNTLFLSVVSARTEPNAPGGPVAQGDPIPIQLPLGLLPEATQLVRLGANGIQVGCDAPLLVEHTASGSRWVSEAGLRQG